MKTIKLTHGKVTVVDDCDFEWLSKFPWHVRERKNKRVKSNFYASRHPKCNGPRYHMHREIADKMGFPPGQIDHIDGDGLNNQRNNLRLASNSQNNANKPKQPNFTSRFKGVYFDKDRNKWSAEITHNWNHYHLGRFNSEILAAITYDKKAIELFGEFAVLNTI